MLKLIDYLLIILIILVSILIGFLPKLLTHIRQRHAGTTTHKTVTPSGGRRRKKPPLTTPQNSQRPTDNYKQVATSPTLPNGQLNDPPSAEELDEFDEAGGEIRLTKFYLNSNESLNAQQQHRLTTASVHSSVSSRSTSLAPHYHYHHHHMLKPSSSLKRPGQTQPRQHQQQTNSATAAAAATTGSSIGDLPSFFVNAISLMVSVQTAITVLGMPVEFYYYGFRSFQYVLSFTFAVLVTAALFVPFVYRIKSTSVYEYLEDKFDGSGLVKMFTLVLAVVSQMSYASLVLFSTAICVAQLLALSHPAVSVWPVALGIGSLSAVLAVLGLESIVWANFAQYVILVVCNVLIIVFGIRNYQLDGVVAVNATAELANATANG
jgi:hypothetical protein